jgi:hypothetical protein
VRPDGATPGVRAMVKLTAPVVKAARSLIRSGHSRRKAARDLGVSVSGLAAALSRRNVAAKIETRGRPLALTPAQRTRALRLFKKQQKTGYTNPTARMVRRQARLTRACSERTVRREFRKDKQKYKDRVQKTTITKADMSTRLGFCKSKRNFNWRSVHLYHDQHSFTIPLKNNPPRSRKCWRRDKDKLKRWAVRMNKKFKAPACRFMSGFSGNGKFVYVDQYKKLTGERVAQMWKSKIMPGLKRAHPGSTRYLVQQDGDQSLHAAAHRIYRRQNGVKIMDGFPPRSGELALMETVHAAYNTEVEFAIAKSRKWRCGVTVNARNEAQWAAFCLRCIRRVARRRAFFLRLVAGMPRRVQKCIAAKGGPIGK